MKKLSLEWLYAAFIRAIKTMSQTALGMFTVGAAISEVNWGYIASVAVVSGIYSLLTSLATSLPEVASDGVLDIDLSKPTKDSYLLNIDDLEGIHKKKSIRLGVNVKKDTVHVTSRPKV